MFKLPLSRFRWLLAAVALLLAGCATGYGGYGAGYPGGYGNGGYSDGYSDRYGQTLYGTVQDVDPYRNRILLAQDRGGRGSRIELQYDRSTRLYYRGEQLPVEGLEPGDGIRVTATRSGGRWVAQSIEVVHNVREGYRGGDRYGDRNQLRGEVVFVDPRAQVIGIERGYGRYGDTERIRYNYRTVIEYRGGRRYRPENLERGDIVRIDLRRWGNGWLAERIRVERDVSR